MNFFLALKIAIDSRFKIVYPAPEASRICIESLQIAGAGEAADAHHQL